MPGITVFGQIAILVGSLFLGLHYALIQCTQPFSGDLAIGILGGCTVVGYALILVDLTDQREREETRDDWP